MLCDPGWITHLRGQLELGRFGDFIERLAEHFTVIRYDSQGGQLAAAIAARYPDRVEALVVYGTWASGQDLAPAEVRKSIVALVQAHWAWG